MAESIKDFAVGLTLEGDAAKKLDELDRKAAQVAASVGQSTESALGRFGDAAGQAAASASASLGKVGDAAAAAGKKAKGAFDEAAAAAAHARAASTEVFAFGGKSGADFDKKSTGAIGPVQLNALSDAADRANDSTNGLGESLQSLGKKTQDTGGLADGLVGKLGAFASAAFLVTKGIQVVSQELDAYDKRIEDAAKATLMTSEEWNKARHASDGLAIATHKVAEEQRGFKDELLEFLEPGRAVDRIVRANAAANAELRTAFFGVFEGANAAADGIKLLNDTAAQFTGFTALEQSNEILRDQLRLLRSLNTEAQDVVDKALGQHRAIDALAAGTISPKQQAENRLRAQGITDPDLIALARKQAGGGGGKKEVNIGAGALIHKENEFGLSLAEEIENLGRNAGATAKALKNALREAEEALQQGSDERVARTAGIGALEQRTGLKDLDKLEKFDSEIERLLGVDIAAKTSRAALAQQAVTPQTLINNVTNTFAFTLTLPIEGGSPADIGQSVRDHVSKWYRETLDRTARDIKVTFGR